MEPSGKDKDNCSVNSKESDGSWSDWSDDEPIQVPSLVSNKVLGSATDVWNEVKDEFGFDFYSASKTHNWELYDVIKLVNYLRKELPAAPLENREASQAVFDSIKPSAAFWEDEQFLLPTVPNDPLLLLAGEEAWGSDSEEEEPQLPGNLFSLGKADVGPMFRASLQRSAWFLPVFRNICERRRKGEKNPKEIVLMNLMMLTTSILTAAWASMKKC